MAKDESYLEMLKINKKLQHLLIDSNKSLREKEEELEQLKKQKLASYNHTYYLENRNKELKLKNSKKRNARDLLEAQVKECDYVGGYTKQFISLMLKPK